MLVIIRFNSDTVTSFLSTMEEVYEFPIKIVAALGLCGVRLSLESVRLS